MLRMYLAKSQGLSLHFASAAEQIFASEKQCPADFMYQEIHLTIASLFFFLFLFCYSQAMCCLSNVPPCICGEREKKWGLFHLQIIFFLRSEVAVICLSKFCGKPDPKLCSIYPCQLFVWLF